MAIVEFRKLASFGHFVEHFEYTGDILALGVYYNKVVGDGTEEEWKLRLVREVWSWLFVDSQFR